MSFSKSKKTNSLVKSKLFSSVQVMAVSALLVALSIVFGKYLSFTLGAFRISFENLTVLMAGIMFGPVIGLTVGVSADVIGCLLKGLPINPIITIGAGCIGLVAGFAYHYLFKQGNTRLLFSVALAHIIGSMVIKSIGLNVYYGFPLSTLILRVPLYIVIGGLEFYIIYVLYKNKAFSSQIERMCRK